MTLKPGDLLRQFVVTTVEGKRFDYDEIWQRRHLLLILWPAGEPMAQAEQFVASRLADADLDAFDTTCVVTPDTVAGLSGPAIVVADRWGEVYFVATAATMAELPDAGDLHEWLRSVDHECPECQGEAR